MKIVQINNTDLPGARFNGYNVQLKFNQWGIETKQLVFDKFSEDENVISFKDSVRTEDIYKNFEERLGLQGLVVPFSQKIMKMEEFIKSDIVHYHLIHNNILSLLDFPKIAENKPSVWTIHDPWIFTGHCIYPLDCKKYKNGCGSCEFLDRHFAMQVDNTSEMWKIKQKVLSKMDIDIVVASKWMYDLVKESPITNHFERVHIIPFGIDLNRFKNHTEDKDFYKKKLGISKDAFVIFFRADRSEYKGLKYIKEMLRKLNSKTPITLLTVGEMGLMNEFRFKYKVKDNGWINDEQKLADLYAAADLFLMPSTAEAFGVMAIEAMASALPIIVLEGTALPGVVHAPKCGFSLPKEDTQQFVYTVEYLMKNQQERILRGLQGRTIAETLYNEEDYFNTLLDLYKNMYKRKNNL